MRDRFVQGSDMQVTRGIGQELEKAGLLKFERYEPSILVDVVANQEPVAVDVEYDSESKHAHYVCPRSGREIAVSLDEIAIYRLIPEVLWIWLADQLEIPSHFRSRIKTPLLGDLLWFLGEAKIGSLHMPVLVARSLRKNLDAVIRSLEARPDLINGVMLFTGKPPDARIAMPSGHVPVSLDQSWITGEESLIINRVLIDRLVTHKPGDAIDSTFSFDESGTLTIGSRSRRFKGKQKAVIAWFWQRRSHDATGFAWVDIKADVQSRSDSLANAMGERIDSDFRLDDWFELVSRGHHRLLRR